MLKTFNLLYVLHYAIAMRVNWVDKKRKEPKNRSRMVLKITRSNSNKLFLSNKRRENCFFIDSSPALIFSRLSVYGYYI
jgi:hypothetical protein